METNTWIGVVSLFIATVGGQHVTRTIRENNKWKRKSQELEKELKAVTKELKRLNPVKKKLKKE